ncbi:unnamed protein product [Protopolystoma xenopodis]|uniref:Uncharacterized protein n=1 Tax=Protopolystoma xenopodis TaxID=117903 RepID=A0A3S5CNG6_9PLAT|nr:unnamed protein product [Protopolystoma xenopodis]
MRRVRELRFFPPVLRPRISPYTSRSPSGLPNAQSELDGQFSSKLGDFRGNISHFFHGQSLRRCLEDATIVLPTLGRKLVLQRLLNPQGDCQMPNDVGPRREGHERWYQLVSGDLHIFAYPLGRHCIGGRDYCVRGVKRTTGNMAVRLGSGFDAEQSKMHFILESIRHNFHHTHPLYSGIL